jgi:hypothetical protein
MRSPGSMACSMEAKTDLLLQTAATDGSYNRAQAIKNEHVLAGGAKGIQTPDLLHAMPSAPPHPALRRHAQHQISLLRGVTREAPWCDTRPRMGALLTTC